MTSDRLVYAILATGWATVAVLLNFPFNTQVNPESSAAKVQSVQAGALVAQSTKHEWLKNKILARYSKVDPNLADEIVKYTAVYAKHDFPRQEDLIAVIAIESSFNPKAVSNLKTDPAIGLTQIRPGAWRHKLSKHDLRTVENQIKHGAAILAHNYQRVNDKALALHAYNLGLTAALRGARSKTYVIKYKRELNALTSA